MVGVGEQFARPFGGRVRGQRPVHGVALREGDLGVRPVHRGGGREAEPAGAVPHRRLQQVGRALDVDPLVQGGFLDGGADARPRGEVHDRVDPALRENRVDLCGVENVALDQPVGVASPFRQRPHVPALDRRVIVVVEIVEGGHGMPPRKHPFRKMGTDEPGAPRDQYAEAGRLSRHSNCSPRARLPPRRR